MSARKAPHALSFPAGNRILASLPREEYARLLPDLSPVRLPQGRTLWEAGDRVGWVVGPVRLIGLPTVGGDVPGVPTVGGRETQNPTPRDTRTDCQRFADDVQRIADQSNSLGAFLDNMARTFTESANASAIQMMRPSGRGPEITYGDSGFKTEFQGSSSPNQGRHYAGMFIAATHGGGVAEAFMNRRERNSGRDGGAGQG